MSRKKRVREGEEGPPNLSGDVVDGNKKKKARDSAETRKALSDRGRGVELSVKFADSSRGKKGADEQFIPHLPKQRRKKNRNGAQEGPSRQDKSVLEEISSGVPNMQVDLHRCFDENQHAEHACDGPFGASVPNPQSKLELVRLLQNTKIRRLRKIEIVCKFIEDWDKLTCTTTDRSHFRIQVTKTDMGTPQFISFVFEWVQHGMLWSLKSDDDVGVGDDTPPHLRPYWDPRYWATLSWCLSSKDLPQAASLSPGLMKCLIQFVKHWSGKEISDGTRMSEDSVKSIEVLLLANKRSFRPDLDDWVSLAATALSSRSFRDEHFARFQPETCHLEFRLLVHVLEGFSRFITIYPNRKKIFLALVDSLLTPLILAHAYLTPRSDLIDKIQEVATEEVKERQKRLLKVTEDILEKGLFHAVHIGSFHDVCTFLSGGVGAVSDVRSITKRSKTCGQFKNIEEERDMTSYQKLLFRKLDKLRQRKEISTADTDALQLTQIGWIFQTYSRNLTASQAADALEIFGLNAKGKRQVLSSKARVGNIGRAAEEESGKVVDTSGVQMVDQKDQNKEARFTVFAELTGPIVTDLQDCWSAAKSKSCNDHLLRAEVLLGGFNGLLKAALEERTYVPTEDSAKQTHFAFLSKCFGVVIDFSKLLPGLLTDPYVAISQNADSRPQGGLVQGNVDKRITAYLLVRLLGEIILATGYLLEMEYRVADNFLDDVWIILLHVAVLQELCKKEKTADVASQKAVRVACQIISAYSDLRQVDRALFTLCRTLRRFLHRASTSASEDESWSSAPSVETLKFLTCAKPFLSAVASAVHTLPEGQVAQFIRSLTADSLETMSFVEESTASRQGRMEAKADYSLHNLFSQIGLIDVYSCILENVSVTPTNSLLCCRAVSSYLKEVVIPNMGKLIDSCLNSEMHEEDHTGSLDKSERRESGEKGIERSGMTWNLIFNLRLFLSSRGLHRQCLHLMPPKAFKKANIEFGGYLIDFHKLDVQSVISRLSAGLFFSIVGQDSVKVSDFMAGLKTKMNRDELLDSPTLHFTLDCIAIESLVDLARHVEAVSFLVTRHSGVSHVPDAESPSRSLLKGGSTTLSSAAAEDMELLKKLRKLLKSLEKESRRLAKMLLEGLPSLSDPSQLMSLHSISAGHAFEGVLKLGCQSNSELTDCLHTASGSSEIQGKLPVLDHATLTPDSMTVRRWHLLCQTFDIWGKFAAVTELKKFLTSLFGCSTLIDTGDDSNHHNGEMPGAEIILMQQVANDLLSNAYFFEEESIRRLFASSFLEAFKSLVRAAFGNWPYEWFTSDTLLEEETLSKAAREFSDLVEAQVGEIEEKDDLEVVQAKKSLVKKRKKWKIEGCELNVEALRKCVALVNRLSALPRGYILSGEATRCAFAVQCFERMLVQSVLHERLHAVDSQEGGNRTSSVDGSNVLLVLEGLCTCRSALLALTSSAVKCSNYSGCSMLTVLSGSFALVQWPSQSLNAAATCLVDIVEYSDLSDEEKLKKLQFGQNLLHIALKQTADLLTYIYDENLQLGGRNGYWNWSASVVSGGKGDTHEADGNGVMNFKSLSSLNELLSLQGRKIDELLDGGLKVEEMTSSGGLALPEGLCGGDFRSWFSGLVFAASLRSYLWSVVSSVDKYAREGLSPEIGLALPLGSVGEVDTLGHRLIKMLSRALVPNGSHAMLLVGEKEIDRNFQWTALETIAEKDGALRPQASQGEYSKEKDDVAEESDEDVSRTTTELVVPVKGDTQDESEDEEEDEEPRNVELVVLKEYDQEKVADGIDLGEADYSKNSATQRAALESLLEGRNLGMCDFVGELYLAAAGVLKLEGARLVHCKASKFSGGLPPGADVLLGAGYWILLKAAKHIRSGQLTKLSWLVGVVKYMESVGNVLSHMRSSVTALAFTKLFHGHLYLLGSLFQGGIQHRNQHSSQPLDALDQLESSTRAENSSDKTRGEAKGTADFTLTEAVVSSLGLMMRTASRHHSVLALQAITRALVGASEDSRLTSGLEVCGDESGKVGRGVAAGIQSLSIALEAVSGTKRLRLLANHFKEFSGAIFSLIECLAGPKIFINHEMGPRADAQTGMVQSAPVLLRCIQIMTHVASRETIYPLQACHVALALQCPAIIFSPVYQSGLSRNRVIRSFLAHDASAAKHEKEVCATTVRIESDLGVELYVACCRLLCSLIRHRRRESGHCIALLGDSARVLLHCLEATYWPSSDESNKVWSTKMATYCGTWLRRIYEEMSEHKETLGKYCCHILSHYLCVLAGHGPAAVGLTREVEAALRPGAYALVDACSANDLQQLHASLGEGPRRNALLALRREYTQQFKYTGKV